MYYKNIINQHREQKKVPKIKDFLNGVEIAREVSYLTPKQFSAFKYLLTLFVKSGQSVINPYQDKIAAAINSTRSYANKCLKKIENKHNLIISKRIIDPLTQKDLAKEYRLNFDINCHITTNFIKNLFPILKYLFFSLNLLISSRDPFVEEKSAHYKNNKVINYLKTSTSLLQVTSNNTQVSSNKLLSLELENSNFGSINGEVDMNSQIPRYITGIKNLKLTEKGKLALTSFSEQAIKYADLELGRANKGKIRDLYKYFVSLAKNFSEKNGLIINRGTSFRLLQQNGYIVDGTMKEDERPYLESGNLDNKLELGFKKNKDLGNLEQPKKQEVEIHKQKAIEDSIRIERELDTIRDEFKAKENRDAVVAIDNVLDWLKLFIWNDENKDFHNYLCPIGGMNTFQCLTPEAAYGLFLIKPDLLRRIRRHVYCYSSDFIEAILNSRDKSKAIDEIKRLKELAESDKLDDLKKLLGEDLVDKYLKRNLANLVDKLNE